MQRRTRTFQAGLLAAILAATLQFVLLAGSLSGAFAADAVGLHAGQCSDTPGGHADGDAACALCPVCLAITLPGVLPAAVPVVPAPVVLVALRPLVAGGAPLLASRGAAAAYPRGPPLI